MTVIFSGNEYKYEIEAVLKLFFPATNFKFLYEGNDAEGDICFVRRKIGREFSHLYITVRLGSKRRRHASKIRNGEEDYDYKCEQELCRSLFLCLKELTGITPLWGTLTGIRPVKRINRMLAEGKSYGEIYDELHNRYFLSEEKFNLAKQTAEVQRPFLENAGEDKFSLYVSIPFCPTRCSYCSFVSHSMKSAIKLIPEYLDRLCEEIELTADIASRIGLTLESVYFGGGTPTSLSAEELRRLFEKVNSCFDLLSVREYNVEAGRADTVTAENLAVIREYATAPSGRTRICINPQTLNNDVLREIGRNHTAEDCIAAYRLARDMGFDYINMDLIAGLPTDTAESFFRTIDGVTELSPENITVHTLSLKRSARLYKSGEAALQNDVERMVRYAARKLGEYGYSPYYLYRQKNTAGNLENVGYSKRGFESLYNIAIMEEIQTILAVGAAASTKIVRNGRPERIFNYKFPYEYISRFEEIKRRKEQLAAYFD